MADAWAARMEAMQKRNQPMMRAWEAALSTVNIELGVAEQGQD